MPALPTFKIYPDKGESYYTDMAQHVTLEIAKDYFCNTTFTDKDENGHEYQWTAVKVEQVQ